MSLLSSLTQGSKLKSANKNVAAARKSEGNQADNLYQTAYKSFAELVADNTFLADTLHSWGFALYNQALTKEPAEAEPLFIESGQKFAFALLANPDSIKPAIDWGAALMAQATKLERDPSHQLYDLAIEKFMMAEAIFSGSASYNLACIYAIRGNHEACLKALEDSRDSSSLPSEEDILSDNDLSNVHGTEWFAEFIESLKKPEPEPEPEKEKAKTDENTQEEDEENI